MLEYVKRVSSLYLDTPRNPHSQMQMNRPYGAVDVAANLKGAVPKTATQKILVALAEKGELVQKIYGEFFYWPLNAPLHAPHYLRKDDILRLQSGQTGFSAYREGQRDSKRAFECRG